MPKYKVSLAKTAWLTINVEAYDEEDAILKAAEHAPGMCARCQGWKQPWSVSPDDEYQSLEDYFGDRYKEDTHGKTVEEIHPASKVVNDY